MELRLQLVLLYFCFFAAACGKKSNNGNPTPPPPVNPPGTTFSNPLLPSGPDPWVIKKDNFYYYTHTLGNRIALWKTQKMSDLKNVIPQTVWTKPATGANSNNVWAPELHFLDNKWYLYYTAGATGDLATQRTFVLENANANPLDGPWTDKGKLADPAADFFAIDGNILTINNVHYLIWSGQASASDNTQRLYIAKMTNPWTLESARVQISSPDFAWEKIGTPWVNEGPEILKNAQGRVFLIYSASGCWTDDYSLGMLTLAENADPMVPANWTKKPTPVFTKKPSGAVYGPGHNAFFKSADGAEDWIIYHANAAPGQGCTDTRSPRMQKFTWNADGSPNFGEPVSTGATITKPSGE
jgi:GH43 family beta-xylosidase